MRSIEISEEVYEKLANMAAERGIAPEDFIRLLLEKAVSGAKGPRKASKHTALARFLNILSEVSEKYPSNFHGIAAVVGRSRIYFSQDPDQIEGSGSGNKPVLIPGTTWWVTSNTSSETKFKLLQRVYEQVGCTTEDRESWLAEFMEDENVAFFSTNLPEGEAEEDPFRI